MSSEPGPVGEAVSFPSGNLFQPQMMVLPSGDQRGADARQPAARGWAVKSRGAERVIRHVRRCHKCGLAARAPRSKDKDSKFAKTKRLHQHSRRVRYPDLTASRGSVETRAARPATCIVRKTLYKSLADCEIRSR